MSAGRSNHSGRQQASRNVAPTSGLPYGYVPAYLPGSASLVEQLDQTMLIVLRDGRHLVGTLRSFDQFSNMILEDTSERKMCSVNGQDYHADTPLGLYVVKGDSLVLMGEIDDGISMTSKEVSIEELEERREQAEQEQLDLEWDFDQDLIS